jgi:thiamine biosynthesis lipoprotein ApbE
LSHTGQRFVAAETELVHRSQPLLGTFVTISAWGPDRAVTLDAISAAFAEFRRADAVMSIHRADSELARVNASAVTNAMAVSPELFAVLQLAQTISAQTDGAFDITIRPLAELWGFIWKQHRLPTTEELERTLPLVDYRIIELDAATRTVRFVAADVSPLHSNEIIRADSRRLLQTSIDLGGIGKGVAVDWAMARLHSLGITNALVKAGGDLRVSGTPPGKTHWTVQLEDPQKQGRRVSIALRDAALSTSGNYENFFEVNGRRYSHILDPRTGLPVEGIAACTVIASTCAESDAWATALFVQGVERSLSEFGDRFAIRFTTITNSGFEHRTTASFPRANSGR